MSEQEKRFPRLLYVGDVPVDATTAGSAFIYRLLQGYPPDSLKIVEGSIWRSVPEKRLPDVDYKIFRLGPNRLLTTRLGRYYAASLFLSARFHSYRLDRMVKDFRPEIVLTVAHGFLWQTAAHLAQRFGLPFNLNINDDWLSMGDIPPILKTLAKRRFGEVYRMASYRGCASPYMVEMYEKEFGVKGNVLYPLLAAEQIRFETSKADDKPTGPLVFAYAGSIHYAAYADCLLQLASVLEPFNGTLLVYSGLESKYFKQYGLERDNLIMRPLVPASELISTLRESADVLFVPMSFRGEHLPGMRAGFPSKFPDYTATGLPLLVWGPRECSAVRWSLENPGFAEVVGENDTQQLHESVMRLVSDSSYRSRLGATALRTCNQYFSHDRVKEEFYKAIIPNGKPSNGQPAFRA